MSGVKRLIKRIIVAIFFHKRFSKNRVLFESNGPYDNAYNVFLYAVKARPDLEIIFYCPDFIIRNSDLNIKDTSYSLRNKKGFKLKKALFKLDALATSCGIVFSSYYLAVPLTKKTKFIYLSHGYGIKGSKRYLDGVLKTGCDLVLPSKELEDIYRHYYCFKKNNVVLCGAARTDDIVYDKGKQSQFDKMVKKEKGEKTILCMPTFRRNADGSFDLNSVFPSYIDLDKLDSSLEELNIRLVVKLHHVFDNVDLSTLKQYKKITFIKNEEVFKNGFNTASIIAYPDALITDYSTAATDFILAGKPIGFLTHDIESFSGIDQGFIVEDPLNYLPGEHINSFEDLLRFLYDVNAGKDQYNSDRERVSMILNGFSKPSLECAKKVFEVYCPSLAKEK